MLKFNVKLLILSLLVWAGTVDAVTPGLAAKRRHDYQEAVRLLHKERSCFPSNSTEYCNYTFEIVECLIGQHDFAEAKKELESVKKQSTDDALKYWLVLQNIISANLDKANKKTALDNLLTIFKDESLSQENRLLIVNFAVPILREAKDYSTALDLIKELNWIKFDDTQYNLKLESCKLLIFSERFDEAEKIIQALATDSAINGAELQQDLTLLLKSYKKDIDFYRQNRPSILRQNSIIHLADLKMTEILTEEPNLKDDLHAALKFSLASLDETQITACKNLFIRLINYEIDNKHFADALKNIDIFAQKYADSPEYSVLMGKKAQIHLNQNEIDLAIKTYDKIIQNEYVKMAERMVAAELAAEYYIKKNDGERALSLYDFMLKNSSSVEENNKINMLIGQYYFNISNFYLATNYLNKINPESKYGKNALLMLIQCNYKLANYKILESNINKITTYFGVNDKLELQEKNLVKFYSAILYEKTDRINKAIANYEELIEMSDNLCLNVAEAILNLGEIYFASNSYEKSALQFLNFAARYPDDKNADKSLYRAVYSYYLAEKIDETIYAVKLLEEKYPKSPYTIKALFYLADHYRSVNNFESAEKTLEALDSLLSEKDLNTKAMVLYNYALIYNENKRYSKALEMLEELENKYPLATMIADSYFLSGVIFTEIGENLQALEAFKKAKENSKDELFVNVCNGKIADNYFILYSKRNNKEYLLQAIELYQKLANDNTNDFFMRTQSFYKLGRAKELSVDYQGALDAYNEAIYIALSNLDNHNQAIPPVWVNKCGVNAIKLNLKKGGRNARSDARRILNKLKEINRELPSELLDLDKLIK